MKWRRGEIDVGVIVIVALLLVAFIIGAVHMRNKEAAERRVAAAAQRERERLEQDKRETMMREEAERERRRKERLMAEDAARAEIARNRIKDMKEAAAVRQEKLADVSRWRDRYLSAQRMFARSSDFEKYATPDEKLSDQSTGRFVVVFPSYKDDKCIYEMRKEQGRVWNVQSLSADGAPVEVDADAFGSRLRREPHMYTTGGIAWLAGVNAPAGRYRIPKLGEDVFIAEYDPRNLAGR